MSDDAHRRGSVVGYAAASIYRAWISGQLGSLKDGEAHLRSAVDLAREHGLTFWLPSAFQCGADILLERPSVDDMSQLVESLAMPPGLAATISGAFVSAVRGRLRLAQGRRVEAIADLFSYPCQIASDAGEVTVTTVATREAWIPQVGRLVSAYRAIGVRSAAFTELHAIELTSRLAQVTVRWTLADGMGRSIYDFEASYSLADYGNGMRIAAIAHNEALRLRASLLRAE